MQTAYEEHIREVALQLNKIRIQSPEDYDYIKDVVANLLRAEQQEIDGDLSGQEQGGRDCIYC